MKKTIAMLGAASAIALATATAAQAGTITGRVTDATETVGLEGAIIRIEETGQTITVGRDGVYRITGLAAGDYTLRISYVGADEETFAVNLPSVNDTVTSDFTIGEDVALIDNILVVGQRGALNAALNRQRGEDALVTVLSADAIGQFADENVAEAARRAGGVNVLNDQGEGRFVSIRGISPNLVSTSVNGVRLTSPEADDRQVGLDVIDADILENIVINKSLTADMDGDSIGGNVEIETMSGLNVDGMMLRGRFGGIFTQQTKDMGYRASITFADNFLDGRLGVAASFSHQNRPFGSENLEIDGEWDLDETVAFPNELEMRDYLVERERTTLALNFDYRVNNNLTFYLNLTGSDFSDQEYRARVEHKIEDGDYSDALSNNRNAVFTAGDYEIDRDIKDRLETQYIYVADVGGEWLNGPNTLDFSLSYTYGEEAEPERIDTAFSGGFDSGEVFGVNADHPFHPTLLFGDNTVYDAFYDPDNFEFDELERVNGLSLDREFAAQVNFRRDMDILGAPGFLQAGLRSRMRTKSYNAEIEVYDGWDGPDDLLLVSFDDTRDYGLGDLGPVPNAARVRDFFVNNQSDFELNLIDTAINSFAEDYRFEEDVFAGYLMAQAQFGDTRVNAGVRVEQTDWEASGNAILLQEFEFTLPGDRETSYRGQIPGGAPSGFDLVTEVFEAEFDGVETEVEGARVYRGDTAAGNDFTDVLPSVNIRHEFTENLVGRAAYYHSIQRANPGQTAPRVLFEQDDAGDVEAEYGNPDLQHQEARNFDLALEWYPNNDSLVSIGYFSKDLDNAIAPIQYEDITVNGLFLNEANTFINLDGAELSGWEFNLYQSLDWILPVDGFLVGFNHTIIDSEATLPDGREIPLPQQADQVTNVIFGFDRGRFDLRAVYTYRDEYLDEIRDGAGSDRIALDHEQVDLSADIRLTDRIEIYADLKNVFDEPFEAATRPDGVDRLEQFEEYGWSSTFGVRLRY